MEERKTAAWVLGVIAMIVIFFTVILIVSVVFYVMYEFTYTKFITLYVN